MSELPEPLVPAEVDLRDFKDFPLDFARLFASDTWVMCNAEEKVAALRLWAASWHQEPAGSLPDNERILADLAGYGVAVKAFQKVRQNAMRGWEMCSDGRYYHPVVAEKAINAWAKKRKKEIENAAERERKRRKKAKVPPETMGVSAGKSENSGGTGEENTGHSAGIPPENALKEKRRDIYSVADATAAGPPTDGGLLDLKAEFWRRAKALLHRHRIDPKRAGGLIGRWLKQIGPPDAETALLHILASAEANCHGDLVEYVTAAIRRRGDHGKRTGDHRNGFAELIAQGDV